MTVSAFQHRLCASRLTPAGRGAVATISVCENRERTDVEFRPNENQDDRTSDDNPLRLLDSLFRAANGKSISEQPLSRIAFGQWGTSNVEELVICRRATSCLEIHCHGGDAAVRRILDDLAMAGCKIVDWQSQFESRFDAECGEALSQSSTWRTTKYLLEQTNGGFVVACQRLRTIEPTDHAALSSQIDELLQWAGFGIHLWSPWHVVLTGRPNVGKSSLINLLLGYQRAIVFDEPGTTRDVVTGDTAFDGWPVILSDTAGIREMAGELESAGIALARRRLSIADLTIVVVDASGPLTSEDEQLLSEYPDSIVVANKSDLRNEPGDRLPEQALLVSCVNNDGIAELQRRIVARLIPRVPPSGTAIPFTERQIQLLRQIKSETNDTKRSLLIQSLVG